MFYHSQLSTRPTRAQHRKEVAMRTRDWLSEFERQQDERAERWAEEQERRRKEREELLPRDGDQLLLLAETQPPTLATC